MTAQRNRSSRTAASTALVVAFIGVALLLTLSASGAQVIHAEFRDAGQLVTGDDVRIAGQPIGSVSSIGLTPDGLATISMNIDDSVWPLHRGTTASIRLSSLAGVANRYIALVPGDAAQPTIPDGGTLGPSQTQGVVDLDQLLNSFSAPVRRDLEGVLRGYADAVRGVGQSGNEAIRYASPAFAQYAALLHQIVESPAAFSTLLRAGNQVSEQLATDQQALHAGLAEAATGLGAIADERVQLEQLLQRAPSVLAQADTTLATTRSTLADSVRPGLQAMRPVAAPLAALLQVLPPASALAVPVLAQLRALLPYYGAALVRLPAVARVGVPAIRASTRALADSLPFFTGLREYGPDLVAGDFGAAGGNIYGTYDANGHYGRFGLETSPVGVAGAYGATYPTTSQSASPPEDGLRLYQLARCPGAADDPAFDGSNPFIQDMAICNVKENLPEGKP